MQLWLRTYVWTLFYELVAVILSVLAGIGTVLTVQTLVEGHPSVVLFLGLIGCVDDFKSRFSSGLFDDKGYTFT